MRLIKSREMGFLEGELELWLENGLISQEQSGEIRGLYSVRRRPLPLMLLEAGGALVGLGLAGFAAANWREMSRLLRTLLIVGAYLACLVSAWGVKRKYPRASRVFLLLSSLVYGAGLFLIAEMYYSRLGWLNFIRGWLGGVLLFALLFRDSWQALLAQGIALLYFFSTGALSLFGAWPLLPLSSFFMPPETWPVMGALLVVTLWAKRRLAVYTLVLLAFALLESRTRDCFGDSAGLVSVAVLGAALSCLPTQKWRWGDSWADLISLERLGIIKAGIAGLALTFPDCWGDFFVKIPPFASVSVLAVAAAVLMALLMLWQFHRGLAAGGAFLLFLAARYFFDEIFDLMSRAWGFTVIGGVCLGAGLLLNWRLSRRKGD